MAHFLDGGSWARRSDATRFSRSLNETWTEIRVLTLEPPSIRITAIPFLGWIIELSAWVDPGGGRTGGDVSHARRPNHACPRTTGTSALALGGLVVGVCEGRWASGLSVVTETAIRTQIADRRHTLMGWTETILVAILKLVARPSD